MRKKVLSVGSNFSLLGLRNKVFETAGYEVTTARTAAQAVDTIRTRQLDVVILGHTLSANLKSTVISAAKERALPVIVLHANAYEARIPEVVANLCGIDGAATILDVLSNLFAGQVTRNLNPQSERMAALPGQIEPTIR